MAASEESCDGNPNFAVICSFIMKFGDICGINISIPYLQQMLEDTKNVHGDLQELLIHLLRRGRKRVNKERWEKCLIKFCHEYSSVDAWEIERFGFLKSKLSVKLELLKRLLELQFDANAKFKAEVNKHDASSLRILPLGRDIDGQAYWYQLDKEYNMRLYQETVGEDGEWKLICSTTEDLRTLLTTLEKKYPSLPGEACENKKTSDLNGPKSPSPDKSVPKKELDTEDLTSCLSETKPCTIIIKTEKKDTLSHSEILHCVKSKNENFSIVNDSSNKMEISESEDNTRVCMKLKLKKEPLTNSNIEQKYDKDIFYANTAIEKIADPLLIPKHLSAENTEPKETDTVLPSKNISNNGIEMKDVESFMIDNCKSEELPDQKCSVSEAENDENSDLNHHKSSKIKLYEKWSNEKKKLGTNQLNDEKNNTDCKFYSVTEEKLCSSSTSNQKDDSAISSKCASVCIDKENTEDHNTVTDGETAVDLSKSSRVNVIVQNTCSKLSLSNDVPLLKSYEEKVDNDICTSNGNSYKVDKSEELEKSSEISIGTMHQSHEIESNKLKKNNKIFPDYYGSSVINSTCLGPGLSHLQALQNMCESNEMGGIPSVIQSTNRLIADCNRSVTSENYVGNNSISFENTNKRCNFSKMYLNDKVHVGDNKVTDVLMKSNIPKKEDEKEDKQENDELHFKSYSCELKQTTGDQSSSSNRSKLLPKDLSCLSINESKNKVDSSLKEITEKKDSITAHNLISPDIKGTIKSNEDNCDNLEKDANNSSLLYSSEENHAEKNIDSHNLFKFKTPLDNIDKEGSLKTVNPHNEKKFKEKNSKICPKDLLEPSKNDSYKNDAIISSDSRISENITPNIALVAKENRNKSVNESSKSDITTEASYVIETNSSLNKSKNKSLEGMNLEASLSVSNKKESEAEILFHKTEALKPTECSLQKCKDKPLGKLLLDTNYAYTDLKQLRNSVKSCSVISASGDTKVKTSIFTVDAITKQDDTTNVLTEGEKFIENKLNCISKLQDFKENSLADIRNSESEIITDSYKHVKHKEKDLMISSDKNRSNLSEIISSVTNSSSMVLSTGDKISEIKIDIDEASEQKKIKIDECNKKKLEINENKIILDDDHALKKKDCIEKHEENKDNFYDDSILKKKDSIEKFKKNEVIKIVYNDKEGPLEENYLEKVEGSMKIVEDVILNEKKESKNIIEESKKDVCKDGFKFKEEDSMGKIKKFEESDTVLEENRKSEFREKDSREMLNVTQEDKKNISNDKVSISVKEYIKEKVELSEDKKSLDIDCMLGKKSVKEKSKTVEKKILDNNKEIMNTFQEISEENENKEYLDKQNKLECKGKSKTVEKELNNTEDNILTKKGREVSKKTLEIEDNNTKTVLEKECVKNIKNNDNVIVLENKKETLLESEDYRGKSKKFDKYLNESIIEGKTSDKDVNETACIDFKGTLEIASSDKNDRKNITDNKLADIDCLEQEKENKIIFKENDDLKESLSPKSNVCQFNKELDLCEEVSIQDNNKSSGKNKIAKSDPKSKSSKSKCKKVPSNEDFLKNSHADTEEAEGKYQNASNSKEENLISKTNISVYSKQIDTSVIEKVKSSKNIIDTKNNFYIEQTVIHNLRHSTCLETKVGHPPFKSTSKPVEPKVLKLLIGDSNEITQVNTKKCLREKSMKKIVDRKPEPTTKVLSSAKKIPLSNSKIVSSKNHKKETSKKDFAIPEGFLEILGNTEKCTEKKGTRKKRKDFDFKVTPDSHHSSENESTPIKRSRRIQEQHQKKMTELAVEMEREQRMLEQMAKCSNSVKKNRSTSQKPIIKTSARGSNTKSTAKVTSTPVKSLKPKNKISEILEETSIESKRTTRKMNSRSKNLTKMTLLYEDESKDSQFSTSRDTEKSKKRRRGRGQRKGFKPWDLSSESSSSIEELTEEEEEEPEEPLIFDVNEDEFACEEVDPNAEPVVIRRARTAKKTEIEDAAEECINDDTPCKKCGKYDKPEWILLCDKCDSGYHTHCLIPPLMLVPDGDWFCQPCEHMALCQCLHEELNKLEVLLKQKEREELRKQRLAYVGISLDNVLKPEKKEKSDESSKEEAEEEDETEKEQESCIHQRPKKESLENERYQKLYGKRSVRARRNINYQFKEYDELIFSALQEDMVEVPEEFKEEDTEADSDKPFTAKISTRKKRARRWKDFDSSDEDDSGEEYQGGSTDSEATAPPYSHSDQESGSGEWKVVKSKKNNQQKTRSRQRRKGYSSDEDWDEVIDNDTYRPTTRRAAQKAISYREISSEEEDEWGAVKSHQSQKRKKASSSESEASFKRKTSKKKRIRKWASSDSSEESEEKSMSSTGESEEEEDESQEEESENDWKVDKVKMRLKASTNKKVLSTDDDDDEEEEESSVKDSTVKKKMKKFISDESEEDNEKEESESKENSEDEEEDEKEEKIEGKVSQSNKISNKKPKTEKKELSSKKIVNMSDKKIISIDKETSLSITENKDFQPKVLVKKELCSVDIPLEPLKQPVTFSAVSEKTAASKIGRKEITKMVPCVIPYEKSPKSGHMSNPEEDNDKEASKEEEITHHPARPPLPGSEAPMSFSKQNMNFMSPSRIRFGGTPAKHKVPPLVPVGHPSLVPPPSSNLSPRFIAPTNLSARPSAPSSVVVHHHASSSKLPAGPSVSNNMPILPPTPVIASSPSQSTQNKSSENKPYKSTIMEPFSNMDDENESDEEVPLERIPTMSPHLPNRSVSYEKEAEYRPAAKELSSYSYAPPDKPFPGSYSSLASFQDFSTRPSPLKPSLVETYPNNSSSPSKLTPLDNYSQSSSPKGFISLDSYSETRKKKHFLGNSSQETEPPRRPAQPLSENYQGGEIRFPPEPYPCGSQSPNTYSHRSPPLSQRDPGTPPRLYSQFPDAYAPPRSPEYYQNHQYYASDERIPRPSYQPNYASTQEPSFVSNPYVATPVPQPNGGFMIDTLLRARNHEEGNEDELTGVTDIVSYITQE